MKHNSLSEMNKDTGWVSLVPYLVNDWVEYSETYPIQYRRVGDIVYLRGFVKDGTDTGILDNLLSIIAPTTAAYFPTAGQNDANNTTGDPTMIVYSSGSLTARTYSTYYTSIACQYLVN